MSPRSWRCSRLVELGAWGSCAGGFTTDALRFDGVDATTALAMRDALSDDELDRSQAAREALAAWLDALRARGARVRLYACWGGDQVDPPVEATRTLELAALRNAIKPFDEGVLYELAGEG